MELNEKIELIDKVLKGLVIKDDIVPWIIDGNQRNPVPRSEIDFKYRIIENELTVLELAQKISGGDNSVRGGYFVFRLLPKGIELIDSKKSVSELYSQIDQEKMLEIRIKEFSLEKLEYEKTIREQEQMLRDLSEKIKRMSLFQKYWWFVLTIFGLLSYSLGKYLK